MAYDLASNHRVASIGNNLYGGFLSVVQSPGKIRRNGNSHDNLAPVDIVTDFLGILKRHSPLEKSRSINTGNQLSRFLAVT